MITEWAAHVEYSGGAHDNGFYSIAFQVWRPNSPSPVVDGCYNKTGSNYFPDIVLYDRAVRETPLASERIHVQPGDVVGFYLTTDRDEDSGIQFAEDYTEESVWPSMLQVISQECLVNFQLAMVGRFHPSPILHHALQQLYVS